MSKAQGKGSMGGKGKGKGKSFAKIMKGHWQVTLSGEWKDYGPEEDRILKQAYLVGQPHAKFQLRGQEYEYDFKEFVQRNRSSGKERKIRPPYGMKPPAQPLVPQGQVVVIAVPEGGERSIEIDDPNNPGRKLTVAVPPNAPKGSQMVVPVPEKGESVEAVVEKQKKHAMTTGTKVAIGTAAGAAAVGALAVGGVILGEHLSDGAVSDWFAGAGADAGDWISGAAADVGDWTAGAAEDVGEWTAGAVEDVGEWTAGAAEDVAEWTAGAAEDIAEVAEDVVDWGAGAAEDIGDFVMSLF